jgi:multiple antibiotic resistance protein
MTTLSAAVFLFLVIDPIGNIPAFVTLLAGIEPRRARRIVLRELLIALALLIGFLFCGQHVFDTLRVSEPALSIAGGVILFLIALKMIFANPREIFPDELEGEPFVVPLATPLVAGPSALATILLLMSREPARWFDWLVAILAAWTVSAAVLLLAGLFSRVLGDRGSLAIQRLMGMLLTTVAVQMFLEGIGKYFKVG